MKNNKMFKVIGWVLIVLGAYDVLNLLFKLIAGQSSYISNSDIIGIFLLIAGVILLLRSKKVQIK